jgi:EmrB/QacA subfamily drug resistance transporter
MQDSSSSRRAIAVALLVAGAFFMEMLDGTVITTAIPRMAQSFGTNPIALNVGITGYLLTLAMLIPMSGWITDRFGSRVVFGSAIAIFTLSSVLCGFCQNLPEFTCARILQGVGGAMMVPVGRLVVLRSTAKRDLVTAIAYITWPALVAPIIGPPLGGFITTYATWRWIFFLNVPLGMIAFLCTLIIIPNERLEEPKPFDWVGFVLSGVSCGTLIFGLDMVGRPGGTTLQSIPLLAVASVLGWLAIRHFKSAPNPLIDLSAMRVPTFAITILGASLFRIGIGATPFLMPLFFQLGFGMSPVKSGTLILAVFVGNLLMKPATTPVLRWFGFRNVLLWNGVLCAASFVACCFFTATTSVALLMVVLFFGGLTRSMQFTCLNAVGFADIPAEEMSAASTLSSTVQQVTFAAGVAFGAIALRLSSVARGSSGATPSVFDFRVAFGFVTLFTVASLVDYYFMPNNAGQEVSGHRRQQLQPALAEEG